MPLHRFGVGVGLFKLHKVLFGELVDGDVVYLNLRFFGFFFVDFMQDFANAHIFGIVFEVQAVGVKPKFGFADEIIRDEGACNFKHR